MKVIYKKHYIGRDIFIIEINAKMLLCYRSSGLSGTGHGGEIIPFSSLNSVHRWSCQIGYIYKEMYLHGRWFDHKKQIDSFPDIKTLMDEIKELVKYIHPRKHKEITDENYMGNIGPIVRKINKDIKTFREQYEEFDFIVLADKLRCL